MQTRVTPVIRVSVTHIWRTSASPKLKPCVTHKPYFYARYIQIFSAFERIFEVTYHEKLRRRQAHPKKYKKLPREFVRVDKTWNKHSPSAVSSDDDTDDELDTGGYGRFSHGQKALVHQHWVDQVIEGGSFGVHCTEAAEAKHKLCMTLASKRVRHLDANTTQSSMLRYLFYYEFFEDLKNTRFANKFVSSEPGHKLIQRRQRLGVPLIDVFTGQGVCMGTDFRARRGVLQSCFIHPEVRVARVELLDMVCAQFGLPQTVDSYELIAKLTWRFGQKLTINKSVLT